jgi:hypothetical protein
MLAEYYRINQATGISVTISHDGNAEISCCQVAAEKQLLTIEKKKIGLPGEDNFPPEVDRTVPVALNISGRGVLYRQIEVTGAAGSEDISKIIPDLNTDDFYLQQFTSGNQVFVALARKTLVDQWIGFLKKQGFNVSMLSFGPYPVSHVLNQLNHYENDIIFDGIKISRDNEKNWLSVIFDPLLKASYVVKLDTEIIDQQLLIPYAAAFQLIMASVIDPVHAEVEAIDSWLVTVLENKKLKVQGAVVLICIFILLLINFVTLSWLNTANSELDRKVTLLSHSSIDIAGQNELIKSKTLLLEKLGWDGGINKALLIDRVSSLLPSEVTLRAISINPIDGSNQRSEVLTFLDKRMRVTGNSDRIVAVNEWMDRLKAQKWVKAVNLENFNFNNELNTGQFSLLIQY